MKVCLLNDSFPPVIDGVANVVLNYAGIMQKENLADVMVATPRYPNTDYSTYPYKVIPYQSFDTTKLVAGYRTGNPIDLKEISEMSAFHPDIIHTHCPVVSTYVARQLRNRTEAPVIFTYHTKFDEDIARAVKSDFLRKESVKFLVNNIETCDEVWVVSQGAGENMKSLGYQGDYRVVSNGVDFAKGRVSAEEVKKVCEGYDLPEGIPVYLFVGRIISYKGIPYIIDAMAKLSAAGQDFRMVIVGSGPDEQLMKEKAKAAGLYENPDTNHPGKVIFTGAIYDRNVLRAWNTRADLFIFPSTYDTNGIVVREAAACGLASVLIQGSCAAEGITDGRNGFLIEQTAEDIARLLAEVGSDLPHLRDVGQHAMDEIYISWEDSVHAAYERYGELLDLKKSGALTVKSHPVAEYFNNLNSEIEQELRSWSEYPSRKFDNMLDNVEEFQEHLQAEAREWKKSIREDTEKDVDTISNQVKASMQGLGGQIAESMWELKQEMKNRL